MVEMAISLQVLNYPGHCSHEVLDVKVIGFLFQFCGMNKIKKKTQLSTFYT